MIKTVKSIVNIITMEQSRYMLWAQIKVIGFVRILKIIAALLTSKNFIKALIYKRETTVSHVLSVLWSNLGSKTAIISDGKSYSFLEFKERVFRAGNSLNALGIKPHEKIAVMLYNSNEYMEIMFASSITGCPNPAVNWHLNEDDIVVAVNRSKAVAFVFDHTAIEKIVKIREKLTSVKQYIMVGGSEKLALENDFFFYESMLKKAQTTLPKGKFIVALNPYTGGTTGAPKSINYYDAFSTLFGTAENAPRVSILEFIELLIKQFSMLYYLNGHKINDIRSLVIAPIYHAGALVGILPFFLGGTLVMMKKFDSEKVLEIIDKENISWIFAVPTIMQRIIALDDKIKSKYDLSSLKTLISAAAPCPLEVKQKINDLFLKQGADGFVFHEYYGAAETGMITLLQPDDYKNNTKRLASVGKIRCGELKVLNIDGKECEINEKGRIHNRSMMTVILNYQGAGEKLKEVLFIIDGQEYYDDGLIGYLDEDNFLYLTGREKELIIMGGVNVYPAELEEKIVNHEKVIDVAVIGIPDSDLGEIVHAEVQLEKGAGLTEKELLKHCEKEGLFGFKLPKSIKFVDELPRHIDGKLMKREVKDKYWKNVKQIG